MPCQRTDPGPILAAWSCSRERVRAIPCSVCGRPQDTACTFELHGAKAGQTCAHKLCAGCAVTVDDSPMCPAHAKLVSMERSRGCRKLR